MQNIDPKDLLAPTALGESVVYEPADKAAYAGAIADGASHPAGKAFKTQEEIDAYVREVRSLGAGKLPRVANPFCDTVKRLTGQPFPKPEVDRVDRTPEQDCRLELIGLALHGTSESIFEIRDLVRAYLAGIVFRGADGKWNGTQCTELP